jgi:hypothetical protein
MTTSNNSNLDVSVDGSRISTSVTGRITFHTPVGQFTTNRLEIDWQALKPPVFTIDGAPVWDNDAGDYVWRKLSVEGEDLLTAIYKLALVPSDIATTHSLTDKIIASLSTQGDNTHVD